LHKWKTIHCKAEKVQKIGHDFYLILWKAFGKAPKSSSMAEGQQEFHLHTTGFETQDLFGGFGFPEWLYQSVYISPAMISVFFLLPSFCQIAKCDSDPSKLTKKKLKEHHQRSTFFTDLVANILY
jgi:hypothetical protein